MSIQFVYGPSGFGKSTYIHDRIIRESVAEPGRRFLLIVPDQFSMQTQIELIRRHPDHAFSNIEILSFSRLAHRILEEVGGEDIPVLDDTGKNLIIRHVAGEVADDLRLFGSKLDRYGFISEIKSTLSEFMQYGLTPDDVGRIATDPDMRRLLADKFHDLAMIYRAFVKYKSDHYLTREETLQVVADGLHKSTLIPDSSIYFDGFTGFTPIQENVIRGLMRLCRTVVFTFTMAQGKDLSEPRNEEDIFRLTYVSASRLTGIAQEEGIPVESDVLIDRRLGDREINPGQAHLERYIFRHPYKSYEGTDDGFIRIYRAANIREEIRDTFCRIRELITKKGYRYRDIAIVSGDLAGYADELIRTASELAIPLYMDYTRSIMTTSFVEALISAYEVIRQDYTRESIIRHMRCSLGPLDREETDILENFLLKTGIRGRSAFMRTWTVREKESEHMSPEAADRHLEQYNRINQIREKVADHFASLHNTEVSYSRALYDFIDNSGMYDRLQEISKRMRESGDTSSAIEYAQIYNKVMDLLDQIEALCGDGIESVDEYARILEAGLSEIKVGVIPQESDQIVVGDMIRTRLGAVRALFLLGVNDCNIPGAAGCGGLLSDMDREYLTSVKGVDLAPTPREQMFTQRLYLYMNMTKPTDHLCISYVTSDPEGRDMQPSYLIDMTRRLFPAVHPQASGISHTCGNMIMPADPCQVRSRCAGLMREYMTGRLDEEGVRYLTALCKTLVINDLGSDLDRIFEMSTLHAKNAYLSTEVARALYGQIIKASISRLESFVGCAYAHFLNYGLILRPRSEYSFERRDLGDVYHKALEEFSVRLKEEGITWSGLTAGDADAWVDEIMDGIVKTYSDTILTSSRRNIAMSRRIRRVVARSVDTIRYQVTQGDFVPVFFERAFTGESICTTSDGVSHPYKLVGKIDRMDVWEKDDERYVRIVDYKSGSKELSLTALYHGFMLQLPIYLASAVAGSGYEPAGMLYYHIFDPLIKGESEMSDDDARASVVSELRMSGLVANDSPVLSAMDHKLSAPGPSDVIHVKMKKDLTPDAWSGVCSPDELKIICEHAQKRSDTIAGRIMDGDIECAPAAWGNNDLPCKYCNYADICSAGSGIPRYNSTRYAKLSKEAALELMRTFGSET